MEDLERLAREVMSAKDASLVENFVKIVLFSRDNPELSVHSRKKPVPALGSQSHLEWLADKYRKGRERRKLPVPGTVPDPALSAVMIHGYKVAPSLIDTQIDGHRWAMVAENVVGDLLERFIDRELGGRDWVWCAGEVVKKIDFIRVSKDPKFEWESLQVKNRDNSENSSSSSVRAGTDIEKWHRTMSKTGETRWDKFPVGAIDLHLTEEAFQEFVIEYVEEVSDSDE